MMIIKTKDADEAAFYWTQNDFELKSVEISEGFKKKILWFVFETDIQEEDFNKLKQDYRNGKTLVEPKMYAIKRAEIKNLIRENIFS
jgi:hypothetical protein